MVYYTHINLNIRLLFTAALTAIAVICSHLFCWKSSRHIISFDHIYFKAAKIIFLVILAKKYCRKQLSRKLMAKNGWHANQWFALKVIVKMSTKNKPDFEEQWNSVLMGHDLIETERLVNKQLTLVKLWSVRLSSIKLYCQFIYFCRLAP